jgi:hypothetical protein
VRSELVHVDHVKILLEGKLDAQGAEVLILREQNFIHSGVHMKTMLTVALLLSLNVHANGPAANAVMLGQIAESPLSPREAREALGYILEGQPVDMVYSIAEIGGHENNTVSVRDIIVQVDDRTDGVDDVAFTLSIKATFLKTGARQGDEPTLNLSRVEVKRHEN